MATDSIHRHTQLQKLSGSDYEIINGQPNIMGWEVKDNQDNTIGNVDELIFDVQSQQVRYLVLDFANGSKESAGRKVLVPIGIALLHKEDDFVLLPDVTPEQLAALPEYDEDRFDTDSKESIRNVFGGLGAAALSGGSPNDDFYDHEHFDDTRLYRNRRSEVFDTRDIPVIKEDWKLGDNKRSGGILLQSKQKGITDEPDDKWYPNSSANPPQ